jgi:Rhamnan synthesis protein F
VSSRLAVMAHFDLEGGLAPHVRRHVEAWSGVVDRLVVVTTSSLQPAASVWLSQRATVIQRPNYGYDFLSYRVGLAEAGPLAPYDEVVLCNDSFVGPLRSYQQIFAEMESRPVDFWGFTQSRRISPHIQSFFAVFRPWVVGSRTFTRFWEDMIPLSDRKQVIHRYEVGMSAGLIEAGFTAGSYFNETPPDIAAARRRMSWWAAHRAPGVTRNSVRSGLFHRRAAEWWNPAIALADRALPSGRLPLVKIDTLRYDPYSLGSASLLSRCEQAFPRHFEGVGDYLARTTDRYDVRAGEENLSTPLALRPARLLVGY